MRNTLFAVEQMPASHQDARCCLTAASLKQIPIYQPPTANDNIFITMFCVRDGVWEISDGSALYGGLLGPSGATGAMVESCSVSLGKNCSRSLRFRKRGPQRWLKEYLSLSYSLGAQGYSHRSLKHLVMVIKQYTLLFSVVD